MLNVRSVTEQLTCVRCGEVFADAFYRPWTGTLVITALDDGARLGPITPSFELRLAQQRLADATAADESAARQRLDFLTRNLGERIYDLPCRSQHSNLATAPQLARALRRTAGRWVSLGPASR